MRALCVTYHNHLGRFQHEALIWPPGATSSSLSETVTYNTHTLPYCNYNTVKTVTSNTSTEYSLSNDLSHTHTHTHTHTPVSYTHLVFDTVSPADAFRGYVFDTVSPADALRGYVFETVSPADALRVLCLILYRLQTHLELM